MAHTHSPQPSDGDSKADFELAVAKGYEPKDLNLRGVLMFLGCLVVTVAVVLVAMEAVMMVITEHERAQSLAASPVAVKLPAVYAPLQPSLGFNGDHENDHEELDMDDMLMMRQLVDQELASSGVSSTGRRYISITDAIDRVADKNMLTVKPVVQPVVQPPNPRGTFEGYTPTLEPQDSR